MVQVPAATRENVIEAENEQSNPTPAGPLSQALLILHLASYINVKVLLLLAIVLAVTTACIWIFVPYIHAYLYELIIILISVWLIWKWQKSTSTRENLIEGENEQFNPTVQNPATPVHENVEDEQFNPTVQNPAIPVHENVEDEQFNPTVHDHITSTPVDTDTCTNDENNSTVSVAVEEQRLCVVCLDKEKDTILVPCGHFCVCKRCAAQLSSCPMCRKVISSKYKVYN